MKKLTLIAAVGFTLCTAALAQNTSVYTTTKSCKTIESSSKEAGYYRGRCAGIGGYKLELIEGDLRQTLDVITPARKRFELNFWQYNGNFSYIGDKLEWRLKKGVPVALIARFNASDVDNSEKTHSLLVVSKIGKKESCVVEVIDPVAKQNEKARESADAAPGKPCLGLPH